MTPIACTVADRTLELHGFDGKQLRLVSPVAFAPGQRLTSQIALAEPLTLALKSLGSVRRPDGRFDVRARPVTLRKEDRDRLLAPFAEPQIDG